jgi:hypothetical protein
MIKRRPDLLCQPLIVEAQARIPIGTCRQAGRFQTVKNTDSDLRPGKCPTPLPINSLFSRTVHMAK